MAVVIKGSGSIEGSSGLEMGANGATEIRGQVNVALGSSVAGDSYTTGISTSGNLSLVQGQLSNRNLIINGAMQVAQRGTSSTTSGYYTVDRFFNEHSGTDEASTQAQVDVSSGTTPYKKGFRKALKITNGNQTSGAGAADFINVRQIIEAQNMAQSGWDYTSSSSYITLSFWVKSSVAQNFHGYIRTLDGTNQNYAFETGSLSSNTWTYITKTIPGNSNLQFDNDNGGGLQLNFGPFWGTDKTGSVSLNTWAAFVSTARMPNNTSTWYTTNDATIEFTGMQLEVGSVATPFEHRKIGEDLSICERYYQNSYAAGNAPASSTSDNNAINMMSWGDGNVTGFWFTQRMRAAPTVTLRNPNATTTGKINAAENNVSASASNINETHVKYISVTSGQNNTWNEVCYELDAEL